MKVRFDLRLCSSVSRKAKVFGLKVKKKKKVNTDIVLENKGAVGKV